MTNATSTTLSFGDMKVSKTIHDKVNHDYDGGPFADLARLTPHSKGAVIESMVEELMKALGNEVKRSGTSDYDRVIDGHKSEVKGSLLWNGKNTFCWQQIRMFQDYDLIYFVAVYPQKADVFVVTKNTFSDMIDKYGFANQHGGAEHDSDEYWFSGRPDDFDEMKLVGSIE